MATYNRRRNALNIKEKRRRRQELNNTNIKDMSNFWGDVSYEQAEFIKQMNNTDVFKTIKNGDKTIHIKATANNIIHENQQNIISGMFPGASPNSHIMVVDENFFNLQNKTQQFLIARNMASLDMDASIADHLMQTKAEIATGFSKEEIIEALNDLKQYNPETAHMLDQRINNLNTNAVNANVVEKLPEEFRNELKNFNYGVETPMDSEAIMEQISAQQHSVTQKKYNEVFGDYKDIEDITPLMEDPELIQSFKNEHEASIKQRAEQQRKNNIEQKRFDQAVAREQARMDNNVTKGGKGKNKTKHKSTVKSRVIEQQGPVKNLRPTSRDIAAQNRIDETSQRFQKSIEDKKKEQLWEQRRAQRAANIQRNEEYKKLFDEADHAEALRMNAEFDAKRDEDIVKSYLDWDKETGGNPHRNNLENVEAISPEQITRRLPDDGSLWVKEHNARVEPIENIINEAIKRTDNLDDAEAMMNKLRREGGEHFKLTDDQFREAKTTLREQYEYGYKSVQENRKKLKRTKGKEIVNGTDSYRIDRSSGKSVATSAQKIAKDKAVQESAEQAAKNLKKATMKSFGHVMNLGFAISDYKDGREAGKSVAGSLVHAGAEFAKGELLGGWYMAAMLAKSVPTMAVSAAEGLNTMARSMNSTQRRQLFGDSQFMDTQQLATMRQSGMELAKMSQYNLQQTLMGNEAEYLHRL